MSDQSLKLHYFLRDDAHEMDAVIRNKCEAEMLVLFRHVAERLQLDVRILSSAREEGGLRDVWDFIKNPTNANLVTVSAVFIQSLISVIVSIALSPASPDKETEALQKELLKASIAEKNLIIKKMRAQMLEPDQSLEAMAAGIALLQLDTKLIARRSNFYKQLLPYGQVSAIAFELTERDAADVSQFYVQRPEFERFIRSSHVLPVDTVNDAVVEIVAPVIKEGALHWKGRYQGVSVSFSMRDEIYKAMVMSKEETFQHGDAIRCVLDIERKVDEAGEIVVTGYVVKVVLEKISGGRVTETKQGRKRRFDAAQPGQTDLFAGD